MFFGTFLLLSPVLLGLDFFTVMPWHSLPNDVQRWLGLNPPTPALLFRDCLVLSLSIFWLHAQSRNSLHGLVEENETEDMDIDKNNSEPQSSRPHIPQSAQIWSRIRHNFGLQSHTLSSVEFSDGTQGRNEALSIVSMTNDSSELALKLRQAQQTKTRSKSTRLEWLLDRTSTLYFFFYRILLRVGVALLLFVAMLSEPCLFSLGYLIFALFFLHRSNKLVRKRNLWWNWIRLYNYVILLVKLIYQNPWIKQPNTPIGVATTKLFGLGKWEQSTFSAFSSPHGVAIDVAVCFLTAVQSYVFGTRYFNYVVSYRNIQKKKSHKIALHVRRQRHRQRRLAMEHVEEQKQMRRARVNQLRKIREGKTAHIASASDGTSRQPTEQDMDTLFSHLLESAMPGTSTESNPLYMEGHSQPEKVHKSRTASVVSAGPHSPNLGPLATPHVDESSVDQAKIDQSNQETKGSSNWLENVIRFTERRAVWGWEWIDMPELHRSDKPASIVGDIETGVKDKHRSVSFMDLDRVSLEEAAMNEDFSVSSKDALARVMRYKHKRNKFLRFVWALWLLLCRNTHAVCYIFCILSVSINGNLLYLIYPIALFGHEIIGDAIFGTHTNRVFWGRLLIFTELLVVLKMIVFLPIPSTALDVIDAIIQWPLNPLRNPAQESVTNLSDEIDATVVTTNDSPLWETVIPLSSLFGSIVFDVLVVLAFLWHRHELRVRGLWHEMDRMDMFKIWHEEETRKSVKETIAKVDEDIEERKNYVSFAKEAHSEPILPITSGHPRYRKSKSSEAQTRDASRDKKKEKTRDRDKDDEDKSYPKQKNNQESKRKSRSEFYYGGASQSTTNLSSDPVTGRNDRRMAHSHGWNFEESKLAISKRMNSLLLPHLSPLPRPGKVSFTFITLFLNIFFQ